MEESEEVVSGVALNPEVIERAKECLAGRSRSYVEDAKLFARLVLDHLEAARHADAQSARRRWLIARGEVAQAHYEAKLFDCPHGAVERDLDYCPDCGEGVPR